MKIIVYTQRVEIVENYNERRDCADQNIPKFIKEMGYLPIPLPNSSELVEQYINTLSPSGIILTGGNSLVKYGGKAPERDKMDYKLIEVAQKAGIPVLGFCRGMQSIVDYFGGELDHVQGHVAVKHLITGEINDTVNSYHNEAYIGTKNIKNIEIIARAEDGVVESIIHKKHPIAGIMWHPERETPFKSRDIQLIKSLFEGEYNER